MKLLICATEYYPHGSGIANVAYNIVEQLKKRGIDCTVCSPTGPDIKLGSSNLIEKSGIVGLLYYWYRVSKYFKDKTEDYDAVWLHNPLFLNRNPFPRSLVTMNSTYYGKALRGVEPKVYYKIVSKIERYCLNRMKKKVRFTAGGPEACRELEEIGVNKELITYIPNGVDIDLFKPADDKKALRREFGIPENGLVILSLGRLTDAKQPLKLVKVFSLIEEEMEDVTLVIAGRGELLEKTKQNVGRKKLRNVKFLGYVDRKDISHVYAGSDYYIIASNYEGQPLTLLEAMASGLPCIVSDIPSLRIVGDARCGIVVDFDDIGKAAEEIIEYLERDNSEDSRNARKYAVNNLDWKIIAGRYLEEF